MSIAGAQPECNSVGARLSLGATRLPWMKRLLLIAGVFVVLVAPSTAAADNKIRRCGDYEAFGLYGILSQNIGCKGARNLGVDWVNSGGRKHVRGWACKRQGPYRRGTWYVCNYHRTKRVGFLSTVVGN